MNKKYYVLIVLLCLLALTGGLLGYAVLKILRTQTPRLPILPPAPQQEASTPYEEPSGPQQTAIAPNNTLRKLFPNVTAEYCKDYNWAHNNKPISSEELFKTNLPDLESILTPEQITELKEFKGFMGMPMRLAKQYAFIVGAELALKIKYNVHADTKPPFPPAYEAEWQAFQAAVNRIEVRNKCNSKLTEEEWIREHPGEPSPWRQQNRDDTAAAEVL